MFTGLVDPPVSFRVSCQVQEQAEQGDAIVAAKPEGNRMRRKRIGEAVRVVAGTPDRLRDDLRYRFGILPVPEKVRGDPRRPGDRETLHARPLAVSDRERVDSHIRAACLVAPRHRELVLISRKVSQFVH
jgi:hypothetical protein